METSYGRNQCAHEESDASKQHRNASKNGDEMYLRCGRCGDYFVEKGSQVQMFAEKRIVNGEPQIRWRWVKGMRKKNPIGAKVAREVGMLKWKPFKPGLGGPVTAADCVNDEAALARCE